MILLTVALAGIVTFSQGMGGIDTIAMLACGVLAGASLSAIARRRMRRR